MFERQMVLESRTKLLQQRKKIEQSWAGYKKV